MKKIVLLIALVFSTLAFAQNAPVETLVITSDGKRHEFQVELAISGEAKSRGLMFRMELASSKGMIFDFGLPESQAGMWMKNTFIPLDMLFIKQDGTIHKIAVNTTPHSTETVASEGNIRAVLELQGGITKTLGIKAGDKVEFGWFNTNGKIN